MSSLSVHEALAGGFYRARFRVGAVLLDALWKLIWLAVAGLAVLLSYFWIYYEISSLEITGPPESLRNPLALLALGRQLWQMYGPIVLAGAIFLVLVLTVAWILLEAYFRAGIFPQSDMGFIRTAAQNFRRFLGFRMLRLVISGTFFVTFGTILFGRFLSIPAAEWKDLWIDRSGAFAVIVAIGMALSFVLTLLETLIRGRHIEMFGREMFVVLGVMATLFTLELSILAIALLFWLAIVAFVSGGAAVLLAIGVPLALLPPLSLIHSYLLVVRFSTLDIVAQQSGEGSLTYKLWESCSLDGRENEAR